MANPERAAALGARLLARAERDRDRPGASTSLRILGLAARELQEPALAATRLRRSIAVAREHPQLAAESRMSLALVLNDLGRPRAALREIDQALLVLEGLPLARARMQHGILLRRLGRDTEALEAYGAALAAFRRHDDRLWQARALTNRGVLQAYRGMLAQARVDLERAEDLYRGLSLTAAVAQVQHNLGFVAAQGGDIVTALTWYDRADEQFRRSGRRPAEALIDRTELLLAARLLPEAHQAARDAVELAGSTRLGSLLPQARLLLAQAALAAGDTAEARRSARLARRAFERQQRERWAVHARYLESVATARQSPRRLRTLAAALDAAGWPEQALDARLRAAATGDAGALAELAAVDVGRGTVRLRIRAWHARALHRLHRGDRAGARRALLAGLRLLDQYRAALGATELRVLSSAEGGELAGLGVRLALLERSGRQVLGWAERWRAATLRLPAGRGDDDPVLARELAELRRVSAELAGYSSDAIRRARPLQRQRVLEDSIRRRTWRTATPDGVVETPGSVDEIVARLGARALVELVEQDGRLLAVVAVDGRIRLQPLVSATVVAAELAALRFAMRRLVLRYGSPASLAAAEAAARHGVRQLDEWLLGGPLSRLVGDRDLVVVPTGALQALPWSALPSCRGRSLAVAPSATAWARGAAGGGAPDGRTVLVAAARPEHALGEVRALAALAPAARVLAGPDATVRATLAAIDGASLVHLAAHGEFRADNPLFSHIDLADGPLTVHDLTGLHRAPDLVVLSACDTGLSAVHPGDELMGLTAALLGAGTRTLVASIGPVDDGATRALMLQLHDRLRHGAEPAAALAAAQVAAPAEHWATAHSFSCFGAGAA
ncbi:CHAT domain-containing tetratricopeptide repeat protein [Catellatospora sp. KI3]|uniref:CHAT domain-containing protein n=1 Tax=Catellatospora sp. KI3 TaxID=3041620 RepID=UPI002482E206|nr:CHAT domain-containing tetratricopeptide repeat protein [Catellatospora sp. KI3]MDI1463774.1 CHAT domain-containing tetratricopeptide repeat protein [Catellatospora sp. KI3]